MFARLSRYFQNNKHGLCHFVLFFCFLFFFLGKIREGMMCTQPRSVFKVSTTNMGFGGLKKKKLVHNSSNDNDLRNGNAYST